MILMLEYFYCILYILGLTYFAHKVLNIDFKENLSYKIVIILLYAVISYFITNVNAIDNDDFIIRNIISAMADFIFIICLLKKGKITWITISFTYFCTFGISSIIMSNMTVVAFNLQHIYFYNDILVRLIITLFINFFNMAIIHQIIKLVKIKKNDIMPNHYYILIFIVYAVYTFLILMLNEELSNSPYNNIFFIICLLIIVLFFIMNIMIAYSIELYNQNQLLKIIDLSNRITAQYVDAFNAQFQEMRKLRHDFRNHIDILNELSKKNVNIQNEYLMNISDKLNSYCGKDIDSNNLYVNACLNMKMIDYPEIIFDITTVLDEDIGIDNDDFCTLFFNLLDNAIESTMLTNERTIVIKILKKEGNLIINMKNPQLHSSNFITSKGKNHGLGMKIINGIINKYNGSIDYMNNEDHMNVYIFIEIASKNNR